MKDVNTSFFLKTPSNDAVDNLINTHWIPYKLLTAVPTPT